MAGIYMVAYALGRARRGVGRVAVARGGAARHPGAPPRHLRGGMVNPYTAALEAGLDPDSPYDRKAMEYLQAEDVLGGRRSST